MKGERIGVSTHAARATLQRAVSRHPRLNLARLDRKRGKKLSNQDWVSRSDPEAKIAKMKDGTTHLAYKPEHAVDLDTGAVAELTTTLPKTLAAPRQTSRRWMWRRRPKIRPNV